MRSRTWASGIATVLPGGTRACPGFPPARVRLDRWASNSLRQMETDRGDWKPSRIEAPRIRCPSEPRMSSTATTTSPPTTTLSRLLRASTSIRDPFLSEKRMHGRPCLPRGAFCRISGHRHKSISGAWFAPTAHQRFGTPCSPPDFRVHHAVLGKTRLLRGFFANKRRPGRVAQATTFRHEERAVPDLRRNGAALVPAYETSPSLQGGLRPQRQSEVGPWRAGSVSSRFVQKTESRGAKRHVLYKPLYLTRAKRAQPPVEAPNSKRSQSCTPRC